jgi:hypothetical protein
MHRSFAALRMTIIGTLVKLIKVIAFIALSIVAAAQEKSAPNLPAFVPRFPLPTSGLEWRQPAMPLQFWDATGRRAAAFGKQDGKFEAWIWPIKVLHGFRLEFRQDGMPEPVRGEAWLREVITRPESTTLVYVHPKFTVREIVWAAPDSPALIVFFDVDSDKPLNITAKFVPDFKPMWPASLGGQHSWWIAEDKAFGLGDAQEKHVALIGSPAVASYTDFMDHSLVGGEMLLGVRVNPHPIAQNRGDTGGATESDYAAIVMSLGMDGEKEARANYEHAILNLRDWYEAKTGEWREFLARTTQIETPDPVLNRAWQWGKVAIHSGWVCTPVPGQEIQRGVDRTGCGMIAGYGPAGDGERPGFAWWFGGDGLMATWAMEDYGDTSGALQELRFLKARQREDGKITHEIVQSLGLVDWFKDFHFAYMHADTTPMYLYSLAEYWRRTGDRKFLEEFWPSAKKAFDWCVSVTGPDGLMDNTKAGLGAIEVGVLKGKVTKDIYLEGFWLAALNATDRMAAAMDDQVVRRQIADIHRRAQNAVGNGWWNREEQYYPFGVASDNQPANIVTPWPAVVLAIGGTNGFEEMRAATARLSKSDMSTDWGVRTISDKDPVYDPVSYNNGTVWPFLNTFVSWMEFLPGNAVAGYVALRNTAQLTGIQSPGYMPEHMNGTFFEPGERSVPHQLFSTVGVMVPAIRGLFGLSSINGRTNDGRSAVMVRFAPAIPAGWGRMTFSNFAIPGGELSGEVRHSTGRMNFILDSTSDRALAIQFQPVIPMGARVQRVLVNGKRPNEGLKLEEGIADYFGKYIAPAKPAKVDEGLVDLPPHTEIEVQYEGGIGIVPPVASPGAGERSSALKVVRVTESGANTVVIEVAGLGGQSYSLNLVSSVPKLSADGATVSKTEDGYRLEIPFQGSGYITREIRVRW